jgi:hypothetical protein
VRVDAVPLALTDEQLATIIRIAQALLPRDRSPFLEEVARELHRKPIGDGKVHRVCRTVQRKYFDPPNLARSNGHAKYS